MGSNNLVFPVTKSTERLYDPRYPTTRTFVYLTKHPDAVLLCQRNLSKLLDVKPAVCLQSAVMDMDEYQEASQVLSILTMFGSNQLDWEAIACSYRHVEKQVKIYPWAQLVGRYYWGWARSLFSIEGMQGLYETNRRGTVKAFCIPIGLTMRLREVPIEHLETFERVSL